MIHVLNNIKEFFENCPGEIIIYGCGHYGFVIGDFLEKCHINFSMFIDEKWGGNGIKRGHADIYEFRKLQEYKGQKIRIILASIKFGEMLYNLHILDDNNEYDFEVLTPVMQRYYGAEKHFDINTFCAYFRKQLIKREPPTLISNDCFAGLIYNASGYKEYTSISPTINVRIKPDDYLKIVLNPHKYLGITMEPEGMTLMKGEGYCEVMPTGRIDDILVCFPHDTKKDVQKCVDRWNYRKNNIQWNRLGFVVRDFEGFSYDFIKIMKKSRYPYRINIRTTLSGMNINEKNILLFTRSFGDYDWPIEEDGFDFVGWYNDFLDEIEGHSNE